jgi:hypothetical protein
MVDDSGIPPSTRRARRADVHGAIDELGGSCFADGSTAAHTVAILRLAGSHPIVRGFPEGVIIVFDSDLRYLAAGGHGLSTVGLSQEMIEGKTIYEVFPPAVASTLEQPYREALACHEATVDIPFGSRTATNSYS